VRSDLEDADGSSEKPQTSKVGNKLKEVLSKNNTITNYKL